MKTLTKDEKDMLKTFIQSNEYKLLKGLAEDFEIDVMRNLKNIDTSNQNDLLILTKNQNYLKGVEDFMKTIESQTNEIKYRK